MFKSKFAYKPKSFVPDDPDQEELQRRQQQLRDAQPTQAAPQQVNRLKTAPKLRNEDGTLNQRYNTSKGQDILAGMAGGARMGMGQDPFFQLGAVLGGAVGGIFNKNIAGKRKHAEEVQEVEQENEQIIFQTNAEMKWKAMEEEIVLKKQREQRMAETAAVRAEVSKISATNKAASQKAKDLANVARLTNDPEAKKAISQMVFQSMGIEAEADEDFATDFRTQKFGDFVYLTDKFGTVRSVVDEQTGQPLSAMSTNDQLRALAAATKLNESTDAMSLQSALDQADGVIKAEFKGGIKAAQYNGLKMQIARQILANAKNDKPMPSTSVTVMHNGERKTFVLDLPKFGETPSTTPSQPTQNGDVNQTSPFMSADPEATRPTFANAADEAYEKNIKTKEDAEEAKKLFSKQLTSNNPAEAEMARYMLQKIANTQDSLPSRNVKDISTKPAPQNDEAFKQTVERLNKIDDTDIKGFPLGEPEKYFTELETNVDTYDKEMMKKDKNYKATKRIGFKVNGVKFYFDRETRRITRVK